MLTHPNMSEKFAMKFLSVILALAACSTAAAAHDIVRSGTVASQPAPAENFTGKVMIQPLTQPQRPGQASASIVIFERGARSHWHTHPAGQILYIVEGCGWTQVEGEQLTRICKGDTVYARPGVKHWHGASATTAMTQLTISESVDGNNVHWLEPVTGAP